MILAICPSAALYPKVPAKLRRKPDCDLQHSVLASESGSLSEAGMIRAVALLSSLLLAATLGAAQDPSTSGATSGQTNSPPPTPPQATIRGCVSSSSLGDDHFTLTQDQTGTVFTLSGMADQVRAQVGHQVEVSGETTSNPPTSAEQGGKSSPESTPTGKSTTSNNAFQVTNVKMLTDHCQASSVSPPPAPANPKATAQPTAELYRAEHTPARILRVGTTQQAGSAADAPTGQSIAGNLPGTSTVLPLLGLVGLCSLVTGFFVRR